MALQVVSPAVNVYRVLRVVNGQEQVEEKVFKRGELLPDWVSPFQQFTLSTTGMAREVGDVADPGLYKAEETPAPVVMPEHNPRTVVGSPITEPMAVVTTTETSGGAVAPLDSLPADDANKPLWEDAAYALGVPRKRAESMRKADLIEEVKARQAAAEEARDLGGPDSTLPPVR